jgi:nitronate monooxygenase
LEAVDSWGVDIVVTQGVEAGGHGVQKGAGIWTLLPEVCEAVGDRAIVVAAGGVSNGKHLAAALMLGAAGVVMGTRFCASVESGFHPDAKWRIVEANDGGQSTVRTRVYESLRGLDWPAQYNFRVLRNDITESGLSEAEAKSRFGAVYSKALDKLNQGGKPDLEILHLAVGEGAGLIKGVWTARFIVEKTLEEARDAFTLASSAVDRSRARL